MSTAMVFGRVHDVDNVIQIHILWGIVHCAQVDIELVNGTSDSFVHNFRQLFDVVLARRDCYQSTITFAYAIEVQVSFCTRCLHQGLLQGCLVLRGLQHACQCVDHLKLSLIKQVSQLRLGAQWTAAISELGPQNLTFFEGQAEVNGECGNIQGIAKVFHVWVVRLLAQKKTKLRHKLIQELLLFLHAGTCPGLRRHVDVKAVLWQLVLHSNPQPSTGSLVLFNALSLLDEMSSIRVNPKHGRQHRSDRRQSIREDSHLHLATNELIRHNVVDNRERGSADRGSKLPILLLNHRSYTNMWMGCNDGTSVRSANKARVPSI
mmetsp:Transcript_45582/g.108430  ORF Transcript_45582/g.108430 Transcript_45582/m.108430 type:complete len:320 (+) Transcript_45582:930-1889(+)